MVLGMILIYQKCFFVALVLTVYCNGFSVNAESRAKKSGDICMQPKKTGLCKAAKPRYYFDSNAKKCTEFIYGGCGGNDNNFHTIEKCQEACVNKNSENSSEQENTTPEINDKDVCNEPKRTGLCKASISRFYYNKDDGTCKTFTYGGCGANGNNFVTLAECREKCGGKSASTLINKKGSGKQKPKLIPMFEDSESDPDKPKTKGDCRKKKETGMCRAAIRRYYYDTKTSKCKKFLWGGCEGNANNFKTVQDCQKLCESQ